LIWTYEKCKEEISKMVYLTELNGKHFKTVMKKNGWYDELTSPLLKGRVKKYTNEEIFNSAIKYKNQRDWIKNEPSIYSCAVGHKRINIEFWEKCVSHMEYIFKPNGYWTYEVCSDLASKYETINEFIENDRLAYDAIKRYKWDDLISHMEFITPNGNIRRYSYEFDTLEKCQKEALNYETRSELANKCSLLYKVINENNWEEKCFSHMKVLGNTMKRFIYAFEFIETNHAYVGLTCDIERRKNAHYYGVDKKFGEVKSNVYNHMVEHNVEPNFKILIKEPVTEENAKKNEKKWMDHYEKNGWTLLNIAKAGSLGKPRKRDYSYYLKIRNECKTLSEFTRRLTSHDRGDRGMLKRDNLWDQLIEGLEVDVNVWTVEKVYEVYDKYKHLTRSQLQEEMAGLYKAVSKYKLLDEMFPIKRKPLSYEHCKKVASQYTYYFEFREKSSAAYNTCLKNKWFDIMSHLIKNVTLKPRKVVTKYTYEICQELSKDCRTRSDFERKYSGAFKFLKKNNLVDDLYPKKKRVLY